jgi:hypothetical protein
MLVSSPLRAIVLSEANVEKIMMRVYKRIDRLAANLGKSGIASGTT